MSPDFKTWLGRRAQVAGVQACGVRLGGETLAAEVWEPDFSHHGLESAWRCVVDTFQVLRYYQAPAFHLRWLFEQSQLHCLSRDDGACLMVFVTRKPHDLDAAGLEAMFAEFQQLGA